MNTGDEEKEPEFSIVIDGQPGAFTDGVLEIERTQVGGLYKITAWGGSESAMLQVRRNEMMDLYLALQAELGDVPNAVAALYGTARKES